MLRKIWNIVSSMKFALILLIILALACAAGSFLPQGRDYEWYASEYSERFAGLIIALQLDDVYHSLWFLILSAFLCCSLLCCNLLRLGSLVRQTKEFARPDHLIASHSNETDPVQNAEEIFEHMRFGKPKETVCGDQKVLFGCRNRAGIWGAWVCHLGILLLILGFGLGQMTKTEYSVYGVSGQTKQIGDTDYLLTIDDFQIGLNSDDTVSQYTASLTVRNAADGTSESAEVSVNNPASMYGYRFYQNATGWAATVSVFKSGEPLQEEILCKGEYLTIKDLPQLAVFFNAFYPDYIYIENSGPATASGMLRNPAYLYSVYYGEEIVGMNALHDGEVIKIDDYEVRFADPRNYTVIQIKRDRFTPLALCGGLITLCGLFLAFYLQPKRLAAVPSPDGYIFFGQSRKGGVLFSEELFYAVRSQRYSKI